jgi:hypothetical protein
MANGEGFVECGKGAMIGALPMILKKDSRAVAFNSNGGVEAQPLTTSLGAAVKSN